ncbi:unnamed protein product [Mytilus coruscus]|uniref:Uncharacterized protein n=1 Tax=Mytilus coruscus TaxID=42192 RepID=A0A6J8DEX8_MYTCO|nr:unnamed protein product [Mytilus coruscus]
MCHSFRFKFFDSTVSRYFNYTPTWKLHRKIAGKALSWKYISHRVVSKKTNGMLYSILSALNVQTVLIGLVVVLFVYKLRQRWKYNLPPGPFCWPLIGSYEVIQAKYLHEIFGKFTKKYGPVFTVSLGPYQMVVLNDINSVTEALVKSKADFANRPFIHSGMKRLDTIIYAYF